MSLGKSDKFGPVSALHVANRSESTTLLSDEAHEMYNADQGVL